MKFTLLTDH